MKKTKILAFAAVMLLLLASFVSAQNNNRQNLKTIEGTLKLKNGDVAIESKGETYFVPILLRYSNFIDGIKEGAKVKLQGYEEGRYSYESSYNMFMPTSIMVNGKTHDISGNLRMRGEGRGYGGRGYRGCINDDCGGCPRFEREYGRNGRHSRW